MTKRRPKLPPADQLEIIFDPLTVKSLARQAFKDGKPTDLNTLRDDIINAARAYIAAVAAPSRGEIKKEILGLIDLAKSNNYRKISERLEQIKEETREFLNYRDDRNLPNPTSLLDDKTRDLAIREIILICTSGVDGQGNYIPFTPQTQAHAPKRLAERDFIFALRIAILNAKEMRPARTAPRSGSGPLATLAAACFELLGVKRINVPRILEREASKNWGLQKKYPK